MDGIDEARALLAASFGDVRMAVEIIAGHGVISPLAEIDISNVAEFDASLDQAVKDSPSGIIINLSGMTYLDSSAVKAMLRARRNLTNPGSVLCIATGPGLARTILGFAHMDLIPGVLLFDSLDAALQHMPPSPLPQEGR